ncbi:MAG: outer membrane protein TolC/ABC-type uncharacterized transport system substrate-binding protein [bacterium]|jgi:outer membrane protein TolC/ABC-type uncharacterized transport system substrate-binding protein
MQSDQKFTRQMWYSTFAFSFLLFSMFVTSVSAKTVHIGILYDGSYWDHKITINSIQRELKILAGTQFNFVYLKKHQINGNYQLDKIQAGAKKLLEDPTVDLIITRGTESAKIFAKNKNLKKPVVATRVEFPIGLGLLDPKTLKPHNPYWTTSYDPSIEASVLYSSKRLFNLKKLVFLCSSFLCDNNSSGNGEELKIPKITLTVKTQQAQVRVLPKINSSVLHEVKKGEQYPVFEIFNDWVKIPYGWIQKKSITLAYFGTTLPKLGARFPLGIAQLLKAATKHIKIETKVISISSENFQQKIAALQSRKDQLVYVSGLYGFNKKQIKEVYTALIKKKLPSISQQGMYGVKQGALIAISDLNYKEIGRTYASKVFSILSGVEVKNISVIDNWRLDLIFNRDTARKIDFDIPIDVIHAAKMVGSPDKSVKYTLEKALQTGLKQNYEVLINSEEYKQALIQVGKAKSGYYPQLSSSLGYTQTDTTRADLSPGPRKNLKFEITLAQTIYNPVLLKTISLAKRTRILAEQNSKLVKLNIKEKIILAYLSYLQAEEIVHIRREHLRTYQKLKEIAQLRYNLQETGKTDVLRVKMQYESARIDMITANENLLKSKFQFNYLLGQPKDTNLTLDKKLFTKKNFSKENDILNKYRTQRQLGWIQDFMTKAVWKNSFELKIAREQLKQAQLKKDKIKSKFLPTVTAGVSWFRQLADEHREFSSDISIGTFELSEENNYNDQYKTGWAGNVTISIPLFQGGLRFKELRESQSKILELTQTRNKVRSDLALNARIIQTTHTMNRRRVNTSHRMLGFSKESFKLGRVSYLQGSIPIMDLLDLQSNVILSEIQSVGTRFQFYHSLAKLLRTINRLDLITQKFSSPKIKDFITKLNLFIKNKRANRK